MALARSNPSPVIEPLPRPSSGPLMAAVPADGGRLRRCTFRRVTHMSGASPRSLQLAVYDIECLYPDRGDPIPLGDLASARAICDACAATGIFRPDED